jgi:hypothetical protein
MTDRMRMRVLSPQTSLVRRPVQYANEGPADLVGEIDHLPHAQFEIRPFLLNERTYRLISSSVASSVTSALRTNSIKDVGSSASWCVTCWRAW